MKIEGEAVVCHSNAGPKFVPKSFECDNDAIDSGGMKLPDQKELASRPKGYEDADRNNIAADGWVVPKLDCLNFDDFNDYDKAKPVVSPRTNSSEVDLFEEDSELFMEKSIVECQLPELIVCYKENICNIVKDICIDEGVPSRDNLEKAVRAIVPPEKDWKDESTRDLAKGETFASDDSEHSESFGDKDSPKLRDSKDSARTPDAEYDVAYFTDNDIINLPMTDLVAGSLKPLINNKNEPHSQAEQVLIEATSLKLAVSACVAEESGSNPKEAMSAFTTSAPVPEDPENSASGSDISYNSKLDNGNITFDFNSLSSTASDGLERCDNGDLNPSTPSTSALMDCQDTSSSSSSSKCQVQCHDTSISLKRVEYEDVLKAGVGNSVSHQVLSQVQRGGVGEASFSSMVPFRSNSDRIGYSGSISIRSDSSTTSTRSFAFPVLQPEWNSSPVRMAKADRKHLRKHRCWKKSILCCRF
ncbi:uncharacterized protein LOC111449304 [Cucurbita moschata]|uniref:Uncharacterized protein LOC111449304 n=1 Tax=Cucurbita moschata TaxID=3662 RepID=A0A6J1FZH8_CUCMO|nr:uncharacterized protein LOC111449304 [Cucurbita moschata]XP_022944917.1 uncharacterized protein LOC111449304 [Cucurbita moschata]